MKLGKRSKSTKPPSKNDYEHYINEVTDLYNSMGEENAYLQYNQLYIDRNKTLIAENEQNQLIKNDKIHFMSYNMIGLPIELKNIGISELI